MTVAPRATRSTHSTRGVRFKDEEIAAGRKTQGNRATGLGLSASGNAATLQASAETSVTARSMSIDAISVSAQYDEYDEQEEDEEEE